MKLPNAEQAIMEDRKLYSYLLSRTHEEGKHKAKFFRLHGYSDNLAETLRTDLLRIAQDNEVDETINQEDGVKYVVYGTMKSPVGTLLKLRTIWFVRNDEDFPRFVTAYPR